MASYSYKRVMFREDFTAVIPEWEKQNSYEGHPCVYDSDPGYDGDGWRVAEHLLDQKDEQIEALQTVLKELRLAVITCETTKALDICERVPALLATPVLVEPLELDDLNLRSWREEKGE